MGSSGEHCDIREIMMSSSDPTRQQETQIQKIQQWQEIQQWIKQKEVQH